MMIRAISSFKTNSTNANSSNGGCGVSQPNFKSVDNDALRKMVVLDELLSRYTDTSTIEHTFLSFLGEVAMLGEESTKAFLTRFRAKVPGLTDAVIERKIDRAVDFKFYLMTHHEGL